MEMVSMENEFKKNPKLKQEDLDNLRKWIDQEKCVPDSVSDVQLVAFLHCCDYNVAAAKNLLKTNYRWRVDNPEYYTERSLTQSPKLQQSLNSVSCVILPQRTSSNELIICVRIIGNNPDTFHPLEVVKLFFMFVDLYVVHHGTSSGLVCLFDCDTVDFALIRKFQFNMLTTLISFLQEALCINVRAIHFMNSNMTFDFGFSMIKPIISSDFLNKIHFHNSGSSSIFSHLPPSSVPKLFKGEENSSLDQLHEQSLDLLRSFEPWFEEEEKALQKFMTTQGKTKKTSSPSKPQKGGLEFD